MIITRKTINLFYYNIFRWERFTQDLIALPIDALWRSLGLTKIANKALKTKDYEEYARNFFNNPKGGPSLVFAGMHVTALATALLISMLNLVSVILKFPKTMHLYGLFVVVVIAIPASVFYLAPTDRKKYLQDFEEFESRSLREKRKWALITLSIILGIWIMCILSFVVVFRSLPH